MIYGHRLSYERSPILKTENCQWIGSFKFKSYFAPGKLDSNIKSANANLMSKYGKSHKQDAKIDIYVDR